MNPLILVFDSFLQKFELVTKGQTVVGPPTIKILDGVDQHGGEGRVVDLLDSGFVQIFGVQSNLFADDKNRRRSFDFLAMTPRPLFAAAVESGRRNARRRIMPLLRRADGRGGRIREIF